jgi:hypothetical protein
VRGLTPEQAAWLSDAHIDVALTGGVWTAFLCKAEARREGCSICTLLDERAGLWAALAAIAGRLDGELMPAVRALVDEIGAPLGRAPAPEAESDDEREAR